MAKRKKKKTVYDSYKSNIHGYLLCLYRLYTACGNVNTVERSILQTALFDG